MELDKKLINELERRIDLNCMEDELLVNDNFKKLVIKACTEYFRGNEERCLELVNSSTLTGRKHIKSEILSNIPRSKDAVKSKEQGKIISYLLRRIR